jgi:hypothetical protein
MAEQTQHNLLIELGLLTANGANTEEYRASEALFYRFCMADQKQMDRLRKGAFIAMAVQHWPNFAKTPGAAGAAFHRCDLDNSGFINIHEFAILCYAFVTNPASQHPFVRQLQDNVRQAVITTSTVVAGHSDVPEQQLEGVIRRCSLNPPDGSTWRGLLASPDNSEIYEIANGIVECVRRLHLVFEDEPAHLKDAVWMTGGKALQSMCNNAGPVAIVHYIQLLTKEVRRLLTAEPTVVAVSSPCKVFGSIHGKLRDLLVLTNRYGYPSDRGGDIETCSYIFNGNFVDYGKHQLEVVLFLFALKSLYPARVFLLRGGHECDESMVAPDVSLRNHIEHRFGGWGLPPEQAHEVYQSIQRVFGYLPLAATIDRKVLVLSGGPGNNNWDLADLRAIPKPIQLNSQCPQVVRDAIFSVPTHDINIINGNQTQFDARITGDFCARNDLQLIVRSNQIAPEGVLFDHEGRIVTITSSRHNIDAQVTSGLLLFAVDDGGFLRVRTKRPF